MPTLPIVLMSWLPWTQPSAQASGYENKWQINKWVLGCASKRNDGVYVREGRLLPIFLTREHRLGETMLFDEQANIVHEHALLRSGWVTGPTCENQNSHRGCPPTQLHGLQE